MLKASITKDDDGRLSVHLEAKTKKDKGLLGELVTRHKPLVFLSSGGGSHLPWNVTFTEPVAGLFPTDHK